MSPVICFGQQPCGFFPRRFLYSKIQTARRLQAELGGEIVFFCHDSDHDPRETQTTLRDRHTEFLLCEQAAAEILAALPETGSRRLARPHGAPAARAGRRPLGRGLSHQPRHDRGRFLP